MQLKAVRRLLTKSSIVLPTVVVKDSFFFIALLQRSDFDEAKLIFIFVFPDSGILQCYSFLLIVI